MTLRVEDAFGELLAEVDRLLTPRAAGRDYSDIVADLVATLARLMTELHATREREVARFHGWLEQQLGCAIGDLAGKTVILEYYEQSVDAVRLLDVVARNYPRRTALNVKAPTRYGVRNPDRERVVDTYEQSMAVLRPILQQIELTDRLIDLIVYRLYGLDAAQMELVDRETGYHRAAE